MLLVILWTIPHCTLIKTVVFIIFYQNVITFLSRLCHQAATCHIPLFRFQSHDFFLTAAIFMIISEKKQWHRIPKHTRGAISRENADHWFWSVPNLRNYLWICIADIGTNFQIKVLMQMDFTLLLQFTEVVMNLKSVSLGIEVIRYLIYLKCIKNIEIKNILF